MSYLISTACSAFREHHSPALFALLLQYLQAKTITLECCSLLPYLCNLAWTTDKVAGKARWAIKIETGTLMWGGGKCSPVSWATQRPPHGEAILTEKWHASGLGWKMSRPVHVLFGSYKIHIIVVCVALSEVCSTVWRLKDANDIALSGKYKMVHIQYLTTYVEPNPEGSAWGHSAVWCHKCAIRHVCKPHH